MQQSDAERSSVRVSVTIGLAAFVALERYASLERRSLSSAAALLLEGALEGRDGAGRVANGDDSLLVVSRPSSAETEREELMVGTQALVSPAPSRSVSACSFDTPRGAKCKFCGKVHS